MAYAVTSKLVYRASSGFCAVWNTAWSTAAASTSSAEVPNPSPCAAAISGRSRRAGLRTRSAGQRTRSASAASASAAEATASRATASPAGPSPATATVMAGNALAHSTTVPAAASFLIPLASGRRVLTSSYKISPNI